MTLDMFAVIFGGATALLPIYATAILHVGARGYGLLASSFELGALVASAALIARRPITRAGPALLVTVGLYGVATIVFGASRWFPLSVVAYAAAGMADQVSVVLRNTAIQLSTPDPLRGRVSAVNMIFIGASNQLGAAESGFVAALTNATFSVVTGGLGCLLVVAIVAARWPRLRRYRTDEAVSGPPSGRISCTSRSPVDSPWCSVRGVPPSMASVTVRSGGAWEYRMAPTWMRGSVPARTAGSVRRGVAAGGGACTGGAAVVAAGSRGTGAAAGRGGADFTTGTGVGSFGTPRALTGGGGGGASATDGATGTGAVGTRATGAGPECDEKTTTAAMPTTRIPAATPPAVPQRHRRSSAVHAVASAGAIFPSSSWSACRTVLTMCLLRAAAADSRRPRRRGRCASAARRGRRG